MTKLCFCWRWYCGEVFWAWYCLFPCVCHFLCLCRIANARSQRFPFLLCVILPFSFWDAKVVTIKQISLLFSFVFITLALSRNKTKLPNQSLGGWDNQLGGGDPKSEIRNVAYCNLLSVLQHHLGFERNAAVLVLVSDLVTFCNRLVCFCLWLSDFVLFCNRPCIGLWLCDFVLFVIVLSVLVSANFANAARDWDEIKTTHWQRRV